MKRTVRARVTRMRGWYWLSAGAYIGAAGCADIWGLDELSYQPDAGAVDHDASSGMNTGGTAGPGVNGSSGSVAGGGTATGSTADGGSGGASSDATGGSASTDGTTTSSTATAGGSGGDASIDASTDTSIDSSIDSSTGGCPSGCPGPTKGEGTPSCDAGVCSIQCKTGLTLCNTTECVDLMSDGNNCSRCGMECSPGTTCQNGSCGTSCEGGLSACDTSCVDTQTDPDHCGNCTKVCARPTSNGHAECNTGQCRIVCDTGLLCGNNCLVCPTPDSHGAANCISGGCGIVCDQGYENCPGTSLCISTASGGCCDASDCMSGPPNTTGTCGSSHTCSYPCAQGFKTCIGSTACISGCCTDADCAVTVATPSCNTSTHACEKLANGKPCVNSNQCMSGSCLTCYPDNDGDTFGDKLSTPTGNFCGTNGVCPLGSVNNNLDCDDTQSVVNPNAGFHTVQYTAPNGSLSWDWNCNTQIDKQAETLSNWNLGCQIGSGCTFSGGPGCLTDGPVNTTAPECGQTIQSIPCDPNSCNNGSSCRTGAPVDTFTQGCR